MNTGIRVRFSATRTILVAPGSAVLVRKASGGSYSAVVAALQGGTAVLTYTPPDAPREVPLGMLISAVRGKRPLDLTAIPDYQPKAA